MGQGTGRAAVRSAAWVLVIALAACGESPASDGGLDAATEDAGTPPEPCASEGRIECAPDAYSVRECIGGTWQVATDCVALNQLCEAETCVDPWTYGSPTFDGCESDPLATSEVLAEKAEYYDDAAGQGRARGRDHLRAARRQCSAAQPARSHGLPCEP